MSNEEHLCENIIELVRKEGAYTLTEKDAERLKKENKIPCIDLASVEQIVYLIRMANYVVGSENNERYIWEETTPNKFIEFAFPFSSYFKTNTLNDFKDKQTLSKYLRDYVHSIFDLAQYSCSRHYDNTLSDIAEFEEKQQVCKDNHRKIISLLQTNKVDALSREGDDVQMKLNLLNTIKSTEGIPPGCVSITSDEN